MGCVLDFFATALDIAAHAIDRVAGGGEQTYGQQGEGKECFHGGSFLLVRRYINDVKGELFRLAWARYHKHNAAYEILDVEMCDGTACRCDAFLY